LNRIDNMHLLVTTGMQNITLDAEYATRQILKDNFFEDNHMSSIKPLTLISLEPTLKEQAIAVAIRLFAELNRGGSSSLPKAKEICKIFGLVLLPKESTMQVVNKKLYSWCLQISFNRIHQAEIEAVLPQLESVWHNNILAGKLICA
jgi:hypothetical protein